MKRKDIIKRVYDLKCDVLDEIRKVLPFGIHHFVQPFFIHYVEGEVANTEVCIAIEVVKEDEQMVRVHHQSEGYGAEDIDITDGDEIFNYEPNSFADILGNLKAEIRGEKLSVLRNLVEQNGGKMLFDGNFRYVGYDPEVCIDECENTRLMGLSLNENGELLIDDIWDGDEYTNSERFFRDTELDRIIEYVRNQSVRKFEIKVVASRIIEVQAASYDDAVKLAKQELADSPLTDADIDCWM